MTIHNESTPGPHPHDGSSAQHLQPAAVARPVKALGMAGFVLLLAAIALVGVVIVAAISGWALTGWITATVVCGVVALACLIGSRFASGAGPGLDRAQHDPLIPETTAEEAAQYEATHPPAGNEGPR